MADFAILAQHPNHPALLIGVHLDATDHSAAVDQAFYLCMTYKVPGLYIPYHPQRTQGIYLVTYRHNHYTHLTTIDAASKAEAEYLLSHLANEGRIVTPDQPIA